MWKKVVLSLIVLAVVVGHVGLWRDPDIPRAAKERLTLLNAIGWAVILLPIFAVNQWLKAKTRDKQ